MRVHFEKNYKKEAMEWFQQVFLVLVGGYMHATYEEEDSMHACHMRRRMLQEGSHGVVATGLFSRKMYPPPHMACMYPPPRLQQVFLVEKCILLNIWHACILLLCSNRSF